MTVLTMITLGENIVSVRNILNMHGFNTVSVEILVRI